MEAPVEKQRLIWLYRIFGWVVAVVPVVYFHNGIVTEYYFSKTIWSNLFVPGTILAYLWFAWPERRVEVPRAGTFLPLVLFGAWTLLSLTWANNPYKSLELLGKVGVAPVVYVATLLFVRSRGQVRGLLYLVVWTMAIVAVYGFFQYFEVVYLPKDQYGEADPSTTIGLTNFTVEYMMPFLLAGPLLFVLDRRRWVRALLLVGWGVVFFYLIVSRNRAGMLGFLMELVLLVLLLLWLVWRYRERFRVSPAKVLALVGAIVIALGIVLGGTTVGRRVSARFVSMFKPTAAEKHAELSPMEAFLKRIRRDASVEFRLETWYQCLRYMFPDNPVKGVGLANLEVEFPRYYTYFLERMTLNNNTRVVRSHNEYVQVLVDLGIVGFLLFAWFLVEIFRTARDGWRRCRDRDDYLLWMAVNLGFVGFAVEMFFAFPLQVPTSAAYFFLAVGLSEAYTRWLRERDARGAATDRDFMAALPVVELDGWRREAFAGVAVLLALTTLGMEIFAWNALIGEVRNKEARVYKRVRRWDEAYLLLTQAIEHYPWMEGYYYDRAVVLMQKGRLREALADLRKTAELVPNYAMGRKQIGMLAAQLGEVELAIAEFEKTAEIYRSERPKLAVLIGQTALRARRPDLAIPFMEEVVAEQEHPDPQLVQLLADAYGMAGQPAKAVPLFERIRGTKVWTPRLRVRYALALLGAERVTEAEREIRSVLVSDAADAEAWYALGKVLATKGDVVGATEAFEKAIALKPVLRDRIKRDPALAKVPGLAAWQQGL